MVDLKPQLEIIDTEGDTVHFNGPSAVTTAINVPSVAGGVISEVLIMVDPDNTPTTAKLEVSFDGGANWYPVYIGGTLTWTPKGNVTQFKVKASIIGLKYYGILNREPV